MAAPKKKTVGKTAGKSTRFPKGYKSPGAWKPGIPSPNPSGRPRLGMTWKDLIQAVGEELCSGQESEYKGLQVSGMTRKEATVRRGYVLISKGSAAILKEFIEREDGKVPQHIDGTINHKLNIYMPKPLPEGTDFSQALPKNGNGKPIAETKSNN